MSELKIRLDKLLDGREISEGAIADVFPIASDGTTLSRSRQRVTIPAGSGSNFRHLAAAPGRYLVEARLPSGEIVSEEIEVPFTGPDVELRLRGSESPREWLSWQHFTGKVAVRPNRAFAKSLSFDPKLDVSEPTASAASAAVVQAGRFENVTGSAALDSSWQWLAIEKSFDTYLADEPHWLGPLSPLQSSNSDLLGQSFVVRSTESAWTMRPLSAAYPRNVVTVRDDKGVELISLPQPWFAILTSEECATDLLVRNNVDEPNTFLSSVTVRDASLGSALAFMTANALPNAAFLFDQAKEMLFYKQLNPLAAAAGAYVLISTQQGPDQQTWHGWVRNLMDLFPWLPDGAIQYGRLKLRDEENDGDVEEARSVLFAAYGRGLPYYSAGIRWLLSGLTILAEDGDMQAKQMARTVHKVSLRTDMSQPFTVVRLGARRR